MWYGTVLYGIAQCGIVQCGMYGIVLRVTVTMEALCNLMVKTASDSHTTQPPLYSRQKFPQNLILTCNLIFLGETISYFQFSIFN